MIKSFIHHLLYFDWVVGYVAYAVRDIVSVEMEQEMRESITGSWGFVD